VDVGEPMLGSAPRFPAFETWKGMSEDEQDAFLAKIENTRRQRAMLLRALVGLLVVAACTALALSSGIVAWR
jgi:hypothetical protein